VPQGELRSYGIGYALFLRLPQDLGRRGQVHVDVNVGKGADDLVVLVFFDEAELDEHAHIVEDAFDKCVGKLGVVDVPLVGLTIEQAVFEKVTANSMA
jgi:hypothetical protein